MLLSEEREYIINDILKRNLELPIKKPHSFEQLDFLKDKDLIQYLHDVYELVAIKFFYNEQKILKLT